MDQITKFIDLSLSKDSYQIMKSDSHIHYYERPFTPNNDTLYVVPSYSISTMKKALSISMQQCNNNFLVALGVAPQEIVFKKFSIDDLANIEEIITPNAQHICAIGEIGIDMHYGTKEILDQMQKLFEFQLSIAEKNNLPVIIHSRKAEQIIYQHLSSYSVNGIMHAYGGDSKLAMKFIDIGFKISIPPIKSKQRKEIIKNTSLNNLVIETDYPYIAKTPELLSVAAEMISEYKKVPIEKVYYETTRSLLSVLLAENRV